MGGDKKPFPSLLFSQREEKRRRGEERRRREEEFAQAIGDETSLLKPLDTTTIGEPKR